MAWRFRWGEDFGNQWADLGGCQNHGPFLGTLNIGCRILIGIQKGTIILTTTHSHFRFEVRMLSRPFADSCLIIRLRRFELLEQVPMKRTSLESSFPGLF